MKMDKVAGSGNDEFYTPRYAISPILKYIPKGSTVWCPFDTKESLFVSMINDSGSKVINTSLKDGQDFFTIEVPQCDFIVSNPPYSKKTEVFERLFDIGKPFAMLVGVVGLFESKKRFDLFKGNEFEIMYFNKRIAYFRDYREQKPSMHPPFSSVYLCHKMLPSTIVFEEVLNQ